MGADGPMALKLQAECLVSMIETRRVTRLHLDEVARLRNNWCGSGFGSWILGSPAGTVPVSGGFRELYPL